MDVPSLASSFTFEQDVLKVATHMEAIVHGIHTAQRHDT